MSRSVSVFFCLKKKKNNCSVSEIRVLLNIRFIAFTSMTNDEYYYFKI